MLPCQGAGIRGRAPQGYQRGVRTWAPEEQSPSCQGAYLYKAPALLVALRDAQQRLAAGEDVRVGGQQGAAVQAAGARGGALLRASIPAGALPGSSSRGSSSITEELPAFPDTNLASYFASTISIIAAGAAGVPVNS